MYTYIYIYIHIYTCIEINNLWVGGHVALPQPEIITYTY